MSRLRQGDICGYIDHKYKGRKIRLHGTVLSLNEADNTAKMKFDNGVISDGIPNEIIHLDEGALDKIKGAARDFYGWAKGAFQKVGGLLRKVVNGVPVPFTRASNIGQMAAEGKLPEGVGIWLGDEAKAEASEAGVSVSDQEAPESDADAKECNRILRAVKNYAEKAEKNGEVKEGVEGKTLMDFAKEGYLNEVRKTSGDAAYESLKNNPMLNEFFGLPTPINEMVSFAEKMGYSALNEAKASENDADMKMKDSENVLNVTGVREIVNPILAQLKVAFKAGEFNKDSAFGELWAKEQLKQNYKIWCQKLQREHRDWDRAKIQIEAKDIAKTQYNKAFSYAADVKPIMIWGAPGIGKTSIVQQCRTIFRTATSGIELPTIGGGTHTTGHKISVMEIVLSKMSADDFTLPSVNKSWGDVAGYERPAIENGYQSWLPIWQKTGDDDFDRNADLAANLQRNSKSALLRGGFKNAKGIEDYQEQLNRINSRNPEEYAKNRTIAQVIGDNPKVASKIKRMKVDLETRWGDLDSDTQNKIYALIDADFAAQGDARYAREHGTGGVRISESRMLGKYGVSRRLNEADDFDDFDSVADKEKNEVNEADILTDGGIIFFDELTRAPKGVMNVIMNLINDRTMGEDWYLGSHWVIVCAANRFWEMSGMDSTWEKAFGTRFIQVNYVPKFEDWIKWAQGYKIDPATGDYGREQSGDWKIDADIIQFLQQNRAHWYQKLTDSKMNDSSDAEGGKTYANPRSWKTATDLMIRTAIQKNGGRAYQAIKGMSPEELEKYVASNPSLMKSIYTVDQYTGQPRINLSDEEKVACIAQATGELMSKNFKAWSNHKYFDNKALNNIIKFGCVKDERPEILEQIKDWENKEELERKDIKKNLRQDVKMQKLFSPTDGEGRIVEATQDTLKQVATNIFDDLKLTQVEVELGGGEKVTVPKFVTLTSEELANILNFFAVYANIFGEKGLHPVFNGLVADIYKYFLQYYYNPDTSKVMSKNVYNGVSLTEAVGDCVESSGSEHEKWDAWMVPSHAAILFMNGFNGQAKGAKAQVEKVLGDAVNPKYQQKSANSMKDALPTATI